MLLHFFTVGVLSSVDDENALNQFLSQHKVVSIDKQLIDDGANSFWSICVTTANLQERFSHNTKSKRKVIDYKDVLSSSDFKLYSELRVLRKQVSGEEGIPAYAVFTNEQLATIVTQNIQSKATLLAIEGVGQARVDKYADKFFSCLQQAQANTHIEP